ncbi:MAG TPA: hypothetical protein VHJ38_04865, partial [Nitrososphaeraceae archaeon]|nr:hypothetical protein [Nitrososphaeraceae archaeon]
PSTNCVLVQYKTIARNAGYRLNNYFVYDKGRYSFPFIYLTGSKSLNPVPNSNMTSLLVSKYH